MARFTGFSRAGWLASTGLAILAASPPVAWAQIATVPALQLAQADAKVFDIPSQPLAGALTAFGRQSGFQVTVDTALLSGLTSQPVSGTLAPDQALSRLLSGTGITYHFTDAKTVAFVKTTGGTLNVPAANVEAARISDPGRTEGTGSYAGSQVTVGSKIPTSIREIPQSVSVITRQRMDDQNISTLSEAMEYTTGVTSARSGTPTSDIAGFFVRGYQADNIQTDGVNTPSHFGNQAAAFDAAIYDRIEVLRGPSGLFSGGGEPGGVINMVRKRPLDRIQVGGNASYGSWDRIHLDADVTGPLVESKKLRGRLVAAYNDQNSYIDLLESERPIVYGVLEADLTETTKLGFGMAYQKDNAGNYIGLPTYADGTFVKVDRSTNVGADWFRFDTELFNTFADLTHRFDSGGQAKVSVQYSDRNSDQKLLEPQSAVNAATGNFTARSLNEIEGSEEFSVDAHVTQPIELGGLTHNLLLGSDYRNQVETRYRDRGPTVYTLNIFNPNHNLAEPFDTPFNSRRKVDNVQYGAYGQARIKPMVDWATVIVGGRLSSYKADTMELAASGTISRSTLDAYGEFTPYAGLIVDVTDDLSVYASYADIFQPQTGTTAAGALLAPRVGEQYEIGVKGEFLDDKLLTHMAVFQIEDMNRAITDPNNAGSSLAAGLVRTRGFEAEVSGEVAPGWNVFGGYSYALATFLEDTTRKGNVFNSRFSPKDSFKLWTRYAFQQPELRGFSVGGGVKYFGRLVNHPVERPGYVTADVQTGYALNNNLSATFTVTNVFDKEYYSAIDSTAGFNQVGEPRAFMLGLRATW